MIDARNIDLIVFDIDGVLTDGKYHINDKGELHKSFFARDLRALRILAKNFKLLFLTKSQSNINKIFVKKIGDTSNVSFIRVPYQEEKLQYLENFLVEEKISPINVIYIGDSLEDEQCLSFVGMPLVVKNAHKQLYFPRLQVNGGEGVAETVVQDMYFPG